MARFSKCDIGSLATEKEDQAMSLTAEFAFLDIERVEQVAIITMRRPPVNAVNRAQHFRRHTSGRGEALFSRERS
jgi:hypothetical protein